MSSEGASAPSFDWSAFVEAAVGGGGKPPTPVAPGGGPPHDPDMELAKLTGRVEKAETAIDGLRHSQNIVLAVLTLGFGTLVGLMVYFGQDFGGQLRDISGRMDRSLERQADQAAQQGARTDRLLEQWAAESRQRGISPAPASTMPPQ